MSAHPLIWSTIIINSHLGKCLFYTVIFKYMVSWWECISYTVDFGAVIQGLTPITVHFPCVLVQDGGAACLAVVLWHRQGVCLLPAFIMASAFWKCSRCAPGVAVLSCWERRCWAYSACVTVTNLFFFRRPVLVLELFPETAYYAFSVALKITLKVQKNRFHYLTSASIGLSAPFSV